MRLFVSDNPPLIPPNRDFNRMRSLIIAILQSVNDALFPPQCYVCRTFLRLKKKGESLPSRRFPDAGLIEGLNPSHIFGTLMRPYLCASCIDDFRAAQSPFCPQCGKLFVGRQGEDHMCGECLKQPKKFRQARFAGVYEGSLLSMIHRYKYHGRVELARPLGALLHHVYMSHWGKVTVDWIVPVPLHARKLRKRGFNQAHLLLKAWDGYFSHQNGGATDIGDDILQRVRWTAPQTGLGRRERQHNIKGAFRLIGPGRVQNRSILLVDDVYTTGATVTECTRVLIDGGAKRVDVVALARAI